MPTTKLSPKEEKRLERFVRDLKVGPIDFIARQKVRILLTILGAGDPRSKTLQAHAVEILQDEQPSKEKRLRKLING